MGYIHWITADPNEERIEEASTAPDFREMQKFVDGFIEEIPVVYKGKRAKMYVNDEALLCGEKFKANPKASEICHQPFLDMCRREGRPVPSMQQILGNAILLEGLKLD